MCAQCDVRKRSLKTNLNGHICGLINSDGMKLRLIIVDKKTHQQSSNVFRSFLIFNMQKNLRGLSPQGNYTDRATAACRRS
jgi:hypothetical protein